MKRLNDQHDREMRAKFPVLWEDDLETDQKRAVKDRRYITALISVFDHMLDEREAYNEIVTYEKIVGSNQEYVGPKAKRYFDREERYLAFYSWLFSAYEIYHFAFPEEFYASGQPEHSQEMRFFKYESLDEYLTHCVVSLREQPLMVSGEIMGTNFINVAIPDLKTLLLGSYDLTNIVYSETTTALSTLKEQLERCGLFLLVNSD